MAVKPRTKVIEEISSDNAVTLVALYDLYDAYTETYFTANEPVTVAQITGWMQCQIEAKLMEISQG